MAILKVGSPYIVGRSCWPPEVHYHYQRDGHHLALFVNGVTACQESDLIRGHVEFVLISGWNEITFCARFGDSIPWCHSTPFRWHGLPQRDRRLPRNPMLTPDSRAEIQVALIEADDGTVRALSSVLLTSVSTSVLHLAIRESAEHPEFIRSPLWSISVFRRLYGESNPLDSRSVGRHYLETPEET